MSEIAPDNRTVVYRADQDTVGVIELYVAEVLFSVFSDGFEER